MKQLHTGSTDEEREKLRQFMRKTKDFQARDRARAILKRMDGASRETIASFLDVHKDTVSNWITAYRKYGSPGLLTKPQTGNRFKLSLRQKEHIRELVTTKTPRQLGFEQDYWDLNIFKRLLKEMFHVEYRSPKSYRKIYHATGFVRHQAV